MPKTKTIKVALNPYVTWVKDDRKELFKIARLVNAITVAVGGARFGLSDVLTPEQAEELNKQEGVEITVTPGS